MIDIFRKLRNPLLLVGFAVFVAACDINAVPRLNEQVNAAWPYPEAELKPSFTATVEGADRAPTVNFNSGS